MLNVAALKRSHERLLAAHKSAVTKVAKEAGEAGVDYARARPRYKPRTGKLSAGNRSVVRVGSKTVVVKLQNRVPYARPIENGSRPHTIRARNAKALAFRGSDGNLVFRRSVRHPGNRPYKFLAGAMPAVKSRFVSAMSEHMRRLARRF